MAESTDKIEKISKVESRRSVDGITSADYVERVAPNKEHFDSLIAAQNQNVQHLDNQSNPARSSLLQEITEVNGRVDLLKKRTPEEIVAQTKNVIAQVDELKLKLQQNPDLKIDPSVETLMNSKLQHIDDKLRIALEKAGGEYVSLETRQARASLRNPIEKFLGTLENGEAQLQNIAKQVYETGALNGSISPANLLAIQIKVGFVQQELEFFTSLLNKTLESTKTLMNVQV